MYLPPLLSSLSLPLILSLSLPFCALSTLAGAVFSLQTAIEEVNCILLRLYFHSSPRALQVRVFDARIFVRVYACTFVTWSMCAEVLTHYVFE